MDAHQPIWRRLAWFVALWATGVAITIAAAELLRLMVAALRSTPG